MMMKKTKCPYCNNSFYDLEETKQNKKKFIKLIKEAKKRLK